MSRGAPPVPQGVGIGIDVQIEGDLLDQILTDDQVAIAFNQAIESFQRMVIAQWERVAESKGLLRYTEYIQGIREAAVSYDVTGNGMAFELSFENRYERAGIIEDGHMAFHLPSRVDWSGPKVKRGKSGPYLHIPFRHSAYTSRSAMDRGGYTVASRRSMMPAQIYMQAKKLAFTTRRMLGPQYDRQGNYRAADQYNWGGRLRHSAAVGSVVGGQEARRGERTVGIDGRGNKLTNPAWASSKWDGLFRVGGRSQTEYMTIRTMTPSSPGWNIPARPGHGVAREVATFFASPAGAAVFEEILVRHLGWEDG